MERMRYALLILILLVMFQVQAKNVTIGFVNLIADDLFFCNLAPANSDRYAQCHNYVGIARTSGTSTISNARLFANFTNSSTTIRGIQVSEVTRVPYNVTEYNTVCVQEGNLSNCYPNATIVTKFNYTNPRAIPASYILNTTRRWFDLYFEIPNGNMVQWNFTIAGGAISAVLDPNTTSACGNIVVANQVYLLNQSVSTTTSCIDILVNGIILDCYGFKMSGTVPTTLNTYGVRASGVKNITVKNCVISGFQSGVYLLNNNNSVLDNLDVSNKTQIAAANTFTYGVRIESGINISMDSITSNKHNSTSIKSGTCPTDITGYAFGFYLYNVTSFTLNNTLSKNITAWLRYIDPETLTCFDSVSPNQYSIYFNVVSNGNLKFSSENNHLHIYGLNASNLTISNFEHDNDNQYLNAGEAENEVFFDFSSASNFISVANDLINATGIAFSITSSKFNEFKDSIYNEKRYSGIASGLIMASSAHYLTIKNNTFTNITRSSLIVANGIQNATISSNSITWNLPVSFATYGVLNQISGYNLTIANNSFINSPSGTTNYGVVFDSGLTNNSLIYGNLNLNRSNTFVAWKLNGINNIVENEMIINSSGASLLQIGGDGGNVINNVTIINATGFVSTNMSFGSSRNNVTIKWYVRANVTDADLIPLSNANVNITNATSSSPQFINLVTTNGLTNWALVTQFIGNNTKNVSYTPHQFNATKTSSYVTWNLNSTQYNITSTMTVPLILSVQAQAAAVSAAIDKFMGGFLTPRIYNLFWMRRQS